MTTLDAGTRRLKAYYQGDSNFTSAASAFMPHTVQAVGADVFAARTYTPGLPSSQIVLTVADFNGDGNADIVGAGVQGVGILIGNGDGTFQASRTIASRPALPFGYPLAIADFNGDGRLDIAIGTEASGDRGNPARKWRRHISGGSYVECGNSRNRGLQRETLTRTAIVDLLVMEQSNLSLYLGAGAAAFVHPSIA